MRPRARETLDTTALPLRLTIHSMSGNTPGRASSADISGPMRLREIPLNTLDLLAGDQNDEYGRVERIMKRRRYAGEIPRY